MLVLVIGCGTDPDGFTAAASGDLLQTTAGSEASCRTFTVHGKGTLFGITNTGIVSQSIDLSAAAFATFSRSHGSLVREVGTRSLFGDGLPFESASSVTSTFSP